MDTTKELQHLLAIVQEKQRKCQEKKRDIIRKMTTKRMLLDESKEILETDLKQSLKQDLKRRNKIEKSIEKKQDVYEIISSPSSVIVKDKQIEPSIQLFDCRGWNMHNSMVWIQAKLHQSTDIKSAFLACLPNMDLPETTCFNQNQQDLYITFKHQGTLLQDIYIYCIYQTDTNTTHTTKPVQLTQWYNEQDASWFDQLVNSFSLSNHVLQNYFPYSTCIQHNLPYINLLKDYESLKEDQVYMKQDHTLLIHVQDKNTIYVYGLSVSAVISFVSQLPSTINIIQSSFNIVDIIRLLGLQDAHIPLSIALSQQS